MEEAFSNSAKAMFNILVDIKKVKKEHKIVFSLSASTHEKLLFDFLSELLFYLDTEFLLFSKFEIKITKGLKLECVAFGDKAINYETKGDVKAMTYNEMSISKSKEGIKIRAVVDI